MTFPKWVGVIGGLSGLAGGLYAAYHAGGWAGLLLAIGGLGSAAATNSHSLLGDGGK